MNHLMKLVPCHRLYVLAALLALSLALAQPGGASASETASAEAAAAAASDSTATAASDDAVTSEAGPNGSSAADEAVSEGTSEATGGDSDIEALSALSTIEVDEDGLYSILLIGSDRRDESWNGNSDTMIMVTVNENLQKVFLVSYMRDLYANVPGMGVHKLNYAYAAGGASLLEETLQSNYGVETDNYMSAGFFDTAAIVDSFGGIDMEVREDEVSWLNAYVDSLYSDSSEAAAHHISSAGYQHLDGVQTVAFSRIRYVGYYDYERTERQRRVLTALAQRIDLKDLTQLIKAALNIMSHTESDLSLADYYKLATLIPDLSNYELVSSRVPFDGTFYSQSEILTPNSLATEAQMIHDLIYEGIVPDQVTAVTADTAQIKQVQSALNEAGYDCGLVDGVMGSQTASAITAYQSGHGLDETGVIDKALLQSLGVE